MSKVIFITGASRGFGKIWAKALLLRGDRVAVTARNPEDLNDLVSEFGDSVLPIKLNVDDREACFDAVALTKKHYGTIDILVNNAGVAPKERKDILEATEESFVHLITTNLQGPYFLTQAVANWMISQQKQDTAFKSCIINISSISSTIASVNRGEYCVAKAGLSMATKLFASRLGEFNIPVYEICPGIIHTDMTAGVIEKYDKLIASGLTIQERWGETEDVGKAVAALALGYFPYSTGQTFMVDGGLTIPRL